MNVLKPSALVVALCCLAGCARLTRHASMLAQELEANEATLAREHAASLDAFDGFVKDMERGVEDYLSKMADNVQNTEKLAVDAIEQRIAALESRMLAQFDQRAWSTLTDTFERSLARRFTALVDRQISNAADTENRLHTIVENNPEDVPARRRYEQQKSRTRQLRAEALAVENRLRKDLVTEIAASRERFRQRIATRVARLETQLEIRRIRDVDRGTVGRIMDPKTGKATLEHAKGFDSVRNRLRQYRGEVQDLHALQNRYLERLQHFLEFRSDVGELIKVKRHDLDLQVPPVPIEAPSLDRRFLDAVVAVEALIQQAERELAHGIEEEFLTVDRATDDLISARLIQFGRETDTDVVKPGR